MPLTRGQLRSAAVLPWVIALLLMVFLALGSYVKFFSNQLRFQTNEELVAELAVAELLEDDATPTSPAEPWPQWRGPHRNGLILQKRLLEQWPSKGPKPLWKAAGGDGYSSFAVGNQCIFTLLGLPDNQECVVCLRTKDGSEVWRYPYRPRTSYDYAGPRSSPSLDGDRLFAVSSDGQLFCLNSVNGKEIWKADLWEDFGKRSPQWGYAYSPLVEGNLVFTMPGGNENRSLAAFDKKTGKLAWSTQDDVGSYSSPIAVTFDGVRQIVFLTASRLLGVRADDGELLWEFPWLTKYQVNAATPLAIRAKRGAINLDYVFISSGYGKGCALVKVAKHGAQFTAQSVYEGNQLCCHFASPVRNGEYLYGLDETRDLTCLNLRTGEICWRQPGFQKGSLIRVNDRLLVLAENGNLALVDADAAEYHELAKARVFRQRCWTSPVLADGKLYLRDQKKILCLKLTEKKP
jgi:outer membrane protein assembly factor BamB